MKPLIITALLAAIGLIGCQSESTAGSRSPESISTSGGGPATGIGQNSETTGQPTGNSSAVDSGNAESESGTDSDEIRSVYTDLDEKLCKTTELNEDEGGWSVQICPGVLGYKLEVEESDIRQTINVISPAGKKSELNLSSVVSPAFSYVGKKAEWRIKRVNGKEVPIALIVRYNASEDPENAEKPTSYLTVTKITAEATCVTDIVKPVKDANLKARMLADRSGRKPCLKRDSS